MAVKKRLKKPVKKVSKKIVKLVKKPKKVLFRKKKNPTSPRLRGTKSSTSKRSMKKTVKKFVARKIRHKAEHKKIKDFPAESLFKAKIKVVGVGGGGGSIVSEIGRTLQKATFVVADTDVRALKKKNGIKYFCFGQEMTHGLGTGLNVDLAKRSAEGAKEKISGIFKDQDIVIFIASLGGGLGSGATQVFAQMAKEFGGITLGIFTMPFKFEGANKQRIALNALKVLRQSLNVTLVIPNEKIFKVIDANTAITDAFSLVNKSLIESLESLIDLIYSPGIINIDFADLRAILSGIGNSAFLNTIEESGKDRADKICDRILINPLLQNSTFEIEKILLNIAGSSNLSMMEVDKISRRVSELNPKSKIIFGISKDQKLKNKIKTTILMTGGGSKSEIVKAEAAKIEKIEKDPIIKVAKEEKIQSNHRLEKPVEKNLKIKNKKQKPKKPKIKKPKIQKPKVEKKKKESTNVPVTFIPVFPSPMVASDLAGVEERKLSVIEPDVIPVKTAIRRSGLEIRKAEELEEKKRQAQEKEWEIPAFLRKRPTN